MVGTVPDSTTRAGSPYGPCPALREARGGYRAAGPGGWDAEAGEAHRAPARCLPLRPGAEHRRLATSAGAGPAGATVRMRTAEELGKDGMLDTATNRAAASTDTYTLAGSGTTETYEPRFVYHGFRYVEVTGFPGTPTLSSLDGRVVHADLASTGTFTSSNALLNRIWRNNRWSVLNNSMSLPTDTPVRDERTPPVWTCRHTRTRPPASSA
ncbi:family 78 glycoside hydrolase catalytic domain [Streptomyces sp. M10(2022)]